MQVSVQQFLQQANLQAQSAIHPLQDAIGVGDCWVRAKGVLPRIVEFGYVMTPMQVYDQQTRSGANTKDAREAAVAAVSALDQGYMFGQAFTRQGMLYGLTHKSHVWPVDKAVLRAAMLARWNPEQMSLETKVQVEAAFRSLRTHIRSI